MAAPIYRRIGPRPADETALVGVTSHLTKFAWEPKGDLAVGFTKVTASHPVSAQEHDKMESAVAREKAIKGWTLALEIALIEKSNPQ